MEISVRTLGPADHRSARAVINAAAEWYRDFLPAEQTRGPEMSAEDWDTESRRMRWFGAFEGETLVGVAGLEFVGDVALLRHGYVLPEHQRHGVGVLLLRRLEAEARGVGRIVVGTYAANHKARGLLEQAGYHLSPDPEAVLRAYYEIPEDRLRASITYERLVDPPPLADR